MRNLVINCNLSVKDSFDEEKVKEAFMSLFIVTVNSDVKINGFRINEIDDSVLEQIPPLPKEHIGWEAPDRSEILAIDKDCVLMKQETFDRLLDYTHSQPTGLYPGKMWKAKSQEDKWMFCWCNHSVGGLIDINFREILIFK